MALPKIIAIAPQRCPVCGNAKLRPHRLARLTSGSEPELEPPSEHCICEEGHVFLYAPLNDPLLERTVECISRSQAVIATSKRLAAGMRQLIDDTRRRIWPRSTARYP